jgi:hypothetical protein
VNDGVRVVIQPASSLIGARMKTAVAALASDREFATGHQLDEKAAKRVPISSIQRVLSQREATRLLRRLDSRR